MVIYSKQELYDFLNKTNKKEKEKQETELSSIFYLVKYNDVTEPIYFFKFEDVYFASPCVLHSIKMQEEELEKYVRATYEDNSFEEALKYEKTLYVDSILYEIDNPQVAPFLPEKIEIEAILSESECLKWLLNHMKK